MRQQSARVRFACLSAVMMLFVTASLVYGQETQPWSQDTSPLPRSTGFVNDYAGVIDAATKQQLETRLKQFKESTNPPIEIAVAVVRTTGDRPIFDYSLAVARGWKIGSKLDDNPSALLMVAVDDRKYFTQVSRDLEDELPDGIAGSLQRQYLVPEFRKGNYGKGIADTIDAYIATINNKGNAPAAAPTTPVAGKKQSSSTPFFGIFCCAGIIIVILLLIFGRSKRGGSDKRDRDRWGGGGFGGGAASALPWIIGGMLGGGSGGGSSDSGGSSGGSDWGGFGGGGDFGGGGAGGDW